MSRMASAVASSCASSSDASSTRHTRGRDARRQPPRELRAVDQPVGLRIAADDGGLERRHLTRYVAVAEIEGEAAVSRISQAYPDRVEVRGRDLAGDLMGRLTFTEYFHLLLTGREATEEQRFFLDVLLVAIAEHGMMPTNVAARMTLAADPGSLHGAVAAGILGAGLVILGAVGGVRAVLGPRCEPRGGRVAGDPRVRRGRCPASAIPCTSRSIRVRNGSSSSPTSAA